MGQRCTRATELLGRRVVTGQRKGVFGWTVPFVKLLRAVVRVKAAVEKAEDRLARAAVSCEKLCAVGEIPIIP
jgi:hypothetical protein